MSHPTKTRPALPDRRLPDTLPRLAELLDGPCAKAHAAHLALLPRLAPPVQALAAALRAGDAERMAFELKRLDALGRAVGTVFGLLEEAQKAALALAGDAGYESVQRVIGEQVHALGLRRRALTAWTTGANALKARAQKAIDAAARAQSRYDARWETLKAQIETLYEETEGFWEHTHWLENLVNKAAGSSTMLDGAERKVQLAGRFAGEKLRELLTLEAQVHALQTTAGQGLASPDFAAQLSRQVDGVRRRLDAAELRLKQIDVAEAVLKARRKDLDTSGIALALDVPSRGVVKVAAWLAGSPYEQMRAMAELHKTYGFDNTPKAMLELLRKRRLVR
jgi:hypothetical protein